MQILLSITQPLASEHAQADVSAYEQLQHWQTSDGFQSDWILFIAVNLRNFLEIWKRRQAASCTMSVFDDAWLEKEVQAEHLPSSRSAAQTQHSIVIHQ